MAQIIAPNKDYTGESASVIFVKGVGETSDAYLIEWFREHGYTVEEAEPGIKTETEPGTETEPETETETEPETETETEPETETETETETEPETVKKPRSRSAKKTEGE